jgi:hypothetical protein
MTGIPFTISPAYFFAELHINCRGAMQYPPAFCDELINSNISRAVLNA